MYCIQEKDNKNDLEFLFTSEGMETKIIDLKKINNSLSEMLVTSIETTTELYNAMENYDLIITKTKKKQ
ncbi:MAG: hypothetical protein ACFFDH_12840 [Promethearchaeota archaeon]